MLSGKYPPVMSLIEVSHWHGSDAGTGSVLESQNLGAVWRTSPLSHQFKWNQSGRTSFRVTQAEVNTATAKWQVVWIIYERLFFLLQPFAQFFKFINYLVWRSGEPSLGHLFRKFVV